jgi:hypothetical protein
MALLVEFCEEKLCREAVKEDLPKALTALADFRTALSMLITWGHKEFKPTLEQVDAEVLFVAETCRHQLMSRYLDPKTEPERVKELHEAILDLAQTGYWPDVLADMDTMLWDAAFARIDELKARAC